MDRSRSQNAGTAGSSISSIVEHKKHGKTGLTHKSTVEHIIRKHTSKPTQAEKQHARPGSLSHLHARELPPGSPKNLAGPVGPAPSASRPTETPALPLTALTLSTLMSLSEPPFTSHKSVKWGHVVPCLSPEEIPRGHGYLAWHVHTPAAPTQLPSSVWVGTARGENFSKGEDGGLSSLFPQTAKEIDTQERRV